MVENRPLLTFLRHLVLTLGVIMVAFPLYVTFVASTLTYDEIITVPMSLLPGDQMQENYAQVLKAEQSNTAIVYDDAFFEQFRFHPSPVRFGPGRTPFGPGARGGPARTVPPGKPITEPAQDESLGRILTPGECRGLCRPMS